MFKEISRMFGSNDPDTPEESDETRDQAGPSGQEPTGADDGLAPDAGEPGDDGGGGADEEPDVTELDVRIDELNEELDSTDASIRELRSSQEEMADSIDEMSDRVRQLVGVYDRIAAEENPFVDDPSEPDPTAGGSPMSTGGEGWSGDSVIDEGHAREETPEPTTAGAEDDVVSFDDLWDGSEESAGRAPPQEDLQAESDAAPMAEQPPVADRTASTAASAADDALLQSIPNGYAGEVLVMEWLATLMERSGPAGAFRAIDYYENVGWISPTVEQRLVDVIGGPALDVFVDPTQPREPTAEEHAVSHEYLRVMARLNEI